MLRGIYHEIRPINTQVHLSVATACSEASYRAAGNIRFQYQSVHAAIAFKLSPHKKASLDDNLHVLKVARDASTLTIARNSPGLQATNMSAGNLQAFLRFLTQDAKVPLGLAMGKIKELQAANLDSANAIMKVKAKDLQPIFEDEKIAKQVLAAAKRVAKKRAAGDDTPSPRKKKRNESLFSDDLASSTDDLEASLALPVSDATEEDLCETVLFTNRAPLSLAFILTLLKYKMPDQPLSSRLSLAQGYIGITSRARAVSLGIEKGKSAGEEGFGEGQPGVMVAGQEIKVLRRWGYEWKAEAGDHSVNGTQSTDGTLKNESQDDEPLPAEQQPALWALDLEALKKSNLHEPIVAESKAKSGATSSLSIYTSQSARAYLLKAFDTAPSESESDLATKKPSAAQKMAEKERNLGRLLQALDIVYASWAVTLSADELDKRTWPWYIKVRPAVADGVAGWGGKNVLRLADIVALKREP